MWALSQKIEEKRLAEACAHQDSNDIASKKKYNKAKDANNFHLFQKIVSESKFVIANVLPEDDIIDAQEFSAEEKKEIRAPRKRSTSEHQNETSKSRHTSEKGSSKSKTEESQKENLSKATSTETNENEKDTKATKTERRRSPKARNQGPMKMAADFELSYTEKDRERPDHRDFPSNWEYPEYLKKLSFVTRPAPTIKKKKSQQKQSRAPEPEEMIIEKILGCNNPNNNSDGIKYFVKYEELSYIHCEWLTAEKIMNQPKGRNALVEFSKFRKKKPLIQSLYIPRLLVLDNSEVDSMWFEVERIIDDSNDDGLLEYLVKWRGLDYTETTWESQKHMRAKTQTGDYKKRLTSSSPRKIPPRWKRPSADAFKQIDKSEDSQTGLYLDDRELAAVNSLVKGYFMQTNILHCDTNVAKQRHQIAAALDYLTEQVDFHGPILVVVHDKDAFQWKDDFEDWSGFNAILYDGPEDSLESILETEFTVVDNSGRVIDSKVQADVVVMPHSVFQKQAHLFAGYEWRTLVIDASRGFDIGQPLYEDIVAEYKIVTFDHLVSKDVRSAFKMLHFLEPNIFEDEEKFFERFPSADATKCGELAQAIEDYVVEKVQSPDESNIKHVEVEPSPQQIEDAVNMIRECYEAVQRDSPADSDALRFMMMQMRIISGHPGLHNAQHSQPMMGGKFIFLDKVLRQRGITKKKVCIFSEIPDLLDFAEELIEGLDLKYVRSSAVENDDTFEAAVDTFADNDDVIVFLYSSKYGARRIDTALFTNIIVLDDDTYKMRAGPDVSVIKLYTRGFPDNLIYSNGYVYDENVIFYAPMDGPTPLPRSKLSSYLRASMQMLIDKKQSDFTSFKQRLYEDTIRISSRNGVGKKPEPLGKLWTPSKSATTDEVSQVIVSLHNNGPQNRPEALRVVRAALSSNHTLTVIERDLIKIALSKANSRQERLNPPDAEMVTEMAPLIINDTLFFLHLQFSLYQINHGIEMPELSDSSENSEENYKLMAYVFNNGLTAATKAVESGEIKCSTINEESIINRIKEIYKKTEEKSSRVDPSYVDFVPPNEIEEEHIEKVKEKDNDNDKVKDKDKEEDKTEEKPAKGGRGKKKRDSLPPVEDLPRRRSERDKDKKKASEETEKKRKEKDTNEKDKEDKDKEKDKVKVERKKPGPKKKEEKIEEKKAKSKKEEVPSPRGPGRPPGVSDRKIEKIKQREQYYREQAEKIPIELYPPFVNTGIVYKVLNTILDFGIPHNKDGEAMWDKFAELMKESDDISLVTDIAQAFTTLAIQSVCEQSDVEIPSGSPISKLGSKLSYRLADQIVEAILLMSEIHSLYSLFKMTKTGYFKRITKSPELPMWWTNDHSRFLVIATYEFGSYSFFRWLVDPRFPFSESIPPEQAAAFKKCAALEQKGKLTRSAVPNDLGDFTWISRRCNRLRKASSLAAKVIALSNDHKAETDRVESYLLIPYSRIRVRSFGRLSLSTDFRSKHAPYPIGYSIERLFKAGDTETWYTCQIHAAAGQPLFTIALASEPDKKIAYGLTPDEAWDNAIKVIAPGTQMKVSGKYLFGLANADILAVLEKLLRGPAFWTAPKSYPTPSNTASDDTKIV